jgi:predicted O-linked N-acetylglucosamine transferase (SPINDLY family)
LKRYEEALVCYEKAISLEPKYVEAYSNKGNVLQALGNYDEALASYESAILIDKTYAPAFYGAAMIFELRKKYDYALGCCDEAIKINPQYEVAQLLRGHIFFQVKDYQNALAAYDQALLTNPRLANAWLTKADIYTEMKQFNEGVEALGKALEIDPKIDFLLGNLVQNSILMCDWAIYDEQLAKLIRGVENAQKVAIPYNFISLLDDRKLIKRAIEIYAKSMQGKIKRVEQKKLVKKKKIRLGYFSSDFHNHPTAYLIAELFECHDKEKFELIGFVFGNNAPDDMRQRLQKSFDQFLDFDDKTDEEIARLAREMHIDIAIDLKGFTKEARPKIFMYGAAPIQISYLAFPGTMGLPCFDYVIADPILVPEQYQDGMIEKIIYMPDSYQVNDRGREISLLVKSRKELGLPESGFVFCCFNNNYKITPAVLDGWVKILKSVDSSVLWLYEDNPYAAVNLKKEAQARGLDVKRLIFSGRVDSADHLARYKNADLFLDTNPCNAHTTASDALWAGLPVLTIAGESFGARVAASLNNAIGLSDLTVKTQEEYEVLAIKLGNNPNLLQEIKARLESNIFNSPLFDTPLFTKNLEAAYLEASERYQKDLPLNHINVAALKD